MSKSYDVIIVGARCGGSPTALLLARKGYRTLLLDRAAFPSDALSTHVVHPLAVDALSRWGALDRVRSSGCPPIDTYAFDFGPFVLEGAPGAEHAPVAYCPRRTVLDKILVDAAAAAGAEVRENVSVDQVLVENGRVVGVRGTTGDGTPMTERAPVVVGADGRNSIVAETVRAEKYNERPPLLGIYYAYWSGLPMRGRFETYIRERRGYAVAETNDGLTMIVCGWPLSEHAANRADVEATYLNALELAPDFADRLRAARRQTNLSGAVTPNFFRKPYGPGWALVGDAGYLKDPITAQGIQDAFRDAERCAEALDQHLGAGRDYDDAMAEYQRDRDADAMPMYDFTCQLAAMESPSPELQRLLVGIHGKQKAMDAFAQTNAGTMSPADFFAPEHMRAMMA